MAHDVAPLSAERHYMGSAASGRYSTDRSVVPTYDRLPSYAQLRQRALARCAQHTRYLRQQDVVGHVLDHGEARAFLEWAAPRLADLEAALAAASAAEKTPRPCGAPAQGPAPLGPGVATVPAGARPEELERAVASLRARMDDALAMKREASRQLRLIGISPQAQAHILRRVEDLLAER